MRKPKREPAAKPAAPHFDRKRVRSDLNADMRATLPALSSHHALMLLLMGVLHDAATRAMSSGVHFFEVRDALYEVAHHFPELAAPVMTSPHAAPPSKTKRRAS